MIKKADPHQPGPRSPAVGLLRDSMVPGGVYTKSLGGQKVFTLAQFQNKGYYTLRAAEF